MQEEYYTKFKCLLEYFVSHLEYKASGNDSKSRGYVTYIKPIKDFKHTGLGYEGQAIQKQIEKWNTYGDNIICINITPSFGRYTTTQCYLNWEETWLNVRPRWKNNHISNLYLSEEEHANAKAILEMSISELGLFDNKPNDKLKEFFDKYYKMIIMYNISISVENYISLLTSNHNLILTGAPGTGKTYLAKQIAQQMIFGEAKDDLSEEEQKMFDEQCGFVQFHPSYDYTDFVEGLRPKQDAGNVGFERKDGVFKDFCIKALKCWNGEQQITNFNDIYSLFIDEIIESNDSLELKTLVQGKKFNVKVNGNQNLYAIPQTEKATPMPITKKMLQEYLEKGLIVDWKPYVTAIGNYFKSRYDNKFIRKESDKNAKYVFIIDEINRGEVSKIFGELFFSIDPGYRGKDGKARTQYANMQITPNVFDNALGINDPNNCGHFFVPENVYIIGTMNDIDRSVESMDFAFRRRFAFKEIKATDRVEMLDDLTWKDEAVKRMNRLNAKIEIIEGLSSAYHIGPAYFLKLKNYNGDFDQLWENHLEGLLREYLRGMQNLEEKLKTLKAAYNNESDSDSGQQQE